MEKKILIIGVVAVGAGVYLMSKRKTTASSETTEEKVKDVVDSRSGDIAASMPLTASAKAVTNKDVNDEEFQDLLEEFRKYNGGSLPAGIELLTIDQLKKRVASLKEVNDLLNKYLELTPDDREKDKSELRKMNASQIQRLINEEQARQDAEYLDKLFEAFRTTCNNHGAISNPAGAKNYAWDVTTLNAILKLSNANLKKLNDKMLNSKDFYYPDNYSAVKSRYRYRTSLSDAIPDGTLRKYRTGASTAETFKAEVKKRLA